MKERPGSILFAIGYLAGAMTPFFFIGLCLGLVVGGVWVGFEWVVG
jgi:hypothetical protein